MIFVPGKLNIIHGMLFNPEFSEILASVLEIFTIVKISFPAILIR